ncbi:GL15256 [Drosophila persimilis]|uniref:GL15256 n=1 Tax=Drosophila persimilis TaxID=7234 RepID=B4GPS0_DROPE|nr:serine protease inhibitor Kazal-type 1 [Drosophila persimilis]EDW25194.1 GL22973 [Drosophila persimilis]EDW39592.1 GL15256 [Drosophila persimilis]
MKFLSILVALCLLLALAIAPIQADDDLSAEKDGQTLRKFCPCPRNYDPVCASNMVTYPNRCEYDCVRREAERRGRNLEFLRSGQC